MREEDERELRELGAQESRGVGALVDEVARDALKAQLFGTPNVARMIGRYRVISILGTGGMGTVMEARDEALGRTVAIKVVRADRGEGSEGQARLMREARSMARLSHPNVVQVYDTGQIDGDVYIAMEYVRGETLRSWLARLDPSMSPLQRRRQVLAHFIAAGRGLAAAHAIGLVHRDFKAENVLIGEDGRARLTDFGLARGTVEPHPERALAPAVSLNDPLTRAGILSGTPAYMAPEQLAGAPADALSDQFTFCVALYEALHGVRPFRGTDTDDLRRAILAGEVQSGSSAAPAWLRAVLLRGLSAEPSARFPSMDALLTALEQDPDRLRRRRLRALGLAVGAAAAMGLLLWLGSLGLTWWRQHEHELAAGQRIARMEAYTAELRARGEPDEARRYLEEDLDAPELQGTRAAQEAWLREAQRRGAEGSGDAGVLSAYARAWLSSVSPEGEIAAQLGIARELHRLGRSVDLPPLLARIAQEHPEQLATPELRALQLEALLAERDLAGALRLPATGDPDDALRRSVLTALSAATQTAYQGDSPCITLDQRDAAGAPVTLVLHGVEGRWAMDARSGSALGPLLRSEGLDWGWVMPVATVDGAGSRLVARDAARGENLLLQLSEEGRLVPIARWSSPAIPLSAAELDLDGDGQPEVYVGEGPGSRDIVQLRVDGGQVARKVGSEGAMSSDVNALVPIRVDGQPTLAAGIGPWWGYDVRLLDWDAEGERLRTRNRVKLGTITALTSLHGADGQELLAAAKADQYPNIRVFPRDRPMGEPAGLYLLRPGPDALTPVATLPGAVDSVAEVITADVNGDGLEDLVVSQHAALTVYAQSREGHYVSLTIQGLSAARAVQADDDPASELAVSALRWSAGGQKLEHQLWVLGVGADPLPTWRRSRWTPPAEAPTDPSLGVPLDRVRALADTGLRQEAASAYARLAPLLAGDSERALARLWAGLLTESLGDVDRATALYLDAAESPRWAASALEGVLRGAVSPTSARQALDAATRALRDPAVQDADRIEAARVQLEAMLSGEGRLALDGEGSIPNGWTLGDPLALRRERGQLHVSSLGDTPLLSAEVDYAGGPLSVELDASFSRLEWSAGLRFELVDADGRPIIELPVQALGGGGLVDHYLLAQALGVGAAYTEPGSPARLEAGVPVRYALRCVLLPESQESNCTIDVDGTLQVPWRSSTRGRVLQPGRYRLVLRGTGEPMAWCEATLHSLRATGLTLASPQPPDPWALALIEGDLATALARMDPKSKAPRDLAARTELQLRLGQLSTGQALLRRLLGEPAAVLRGIRRLPELYLPLLSSTLGDGVFPLVREALALAWTMHPDDLRLDDELARALTGLDAYAGRAQGEDRAVARDLLRWRARLFAHKGDLRAARADLERALELDRTLLSPREPDDETRALLLLELAELERRDGQPERAVERLVMARAAARSGEKVGDMIAARPELLALEGPR